METKINLSKMGVNSYWNNNGLYQSDYDELYKQLVPPSGEASTYNGEILRAVSRLGHEYNNNGNCNTYDPKEIEGEWIECRHCNGSGVVENEDGEEENCEECGGEGGYYEDSEYEYIPDVFFHNFLKLLEETFEGNDEALNVINKVARIIDNAPYDEGHRIYFSDENQNAYDQMVDYVIMYIKEHKGDNKVIPEWYLKSE